MKKGVLKTGYRDLQDCLFEILKVPQRLNRCDEVLKMELLEHIENETSSVIGSINEVMMFNPNYPYPKEYINNHFGYWAGNILQPFTYNQLQYLKELIQNSIKTVNTPLKDNSKDLTLSENKDFDRHIFKNLNSQQLFYYIVNQLVINSRKDIGAFYSWFSSYLICSKYDFAMYWNSLEQPYKIKTYSRKSVNFRSVSTDGMDRELNNLKLELNDIGKVGTKSVHIETIR